MVVGLLASALTGLQDPRKLNPALICNIGETLFWFLPRRAREFLRFHVGDDYVSSTKFHHQLIALSRRTVLQQRGTQPTKPIDAYGENNPAFSLELGKIPSPTPT